MIASGTIRVLAVVLALATATVAAQDDQTVSVDNSAQARADSSAAPGGETKTQTPQFQERDARYRLCKGDILDLTFPFTPEFNQSVTVQPDGYIALLGLGDIHVEGDTVPELRRALKNAYTKLLDDPVISIALKDFAKPYFIASGQLNKPGKYDLREDTTAAEAVAIAGGFTDSAKHSQVILFRRVSKDWVETKQLDLKKMLKTGNLSEDVHLQSGDMLFVPKNTISKISRFLPSASTGLYLAPNPQF
jgi:polysaccharide biosynthesis/export protein